MPERVMSQYYTQEQMEDVLDILNAYSKVSQEQKPILSAMMNAFISGMEAQERLTQTVAG